MKTKITKSTKSKILMKKLCKLQKILKGLNQKLFEFFKH
jgi:hypothetical protein